MDLVRAAIDLLQRIHEAHLTGGSTISEQCHESEANDEPRDETTLIQG
jgi:hypothetical protein